MVGSSSSSSAEDGAVCELCGDPPSEGAMCSCSQGHTVCRVCLRQFVLYTHGLQVGRTPPRLASTSPSCSHPPPFLHVLLAPAFCLAMYIIERSFLVERPFLSAPSHSCDQSRPDHNAHILPINVSYSDLAALVLLCNCDPCRERPQYLQDVNADGAAIFEVPGVCGG